MQLMRHIRKTSSGLALIELIIALGILGAITAAVVSLASRSLSANNINTLVSNITELTVSLKSVFKGRYLIDSSASDDTEGLRDILLAFDVVTEDTFLNPLGGPLEMEITKVNDTPDRGVFIKIPNLRSQDCLAVTKQLFAGAEYMYVKEDGDFESDLRVSTITDAHLKTLGGGEAYSIAASREACGADNNISVIIGLR